MPTIRESLIHGTKLLRDAGVDRPTHEASILLSAAEGLTKEGLYARATDATSPGGAERYECYLSMRRTGTPIAYILEEKEFYGRLFHTDPRALIPRPDTEILVDRALELVRHLHTTGANTTRANPAVADRLKADVGGAAPDPTEGAKPGERRLHIHDCCTGTGCVPITIALELRELGINDVTVSASDLSEAALEVARENGERLAPSLVSFRQMDLLSESAADSYDLITANPPYLTSEETTEVLSKGWGEPRMALDGGAKGLELLPRLVNESMASLRKNGYILIEATDAQASEIRALLQEAGFSAIQTVRDLAGRERVTEGRR